MKVNTCVRFWYYIANCVAIHPKPQASEYQGVYVLQIINYVYGYYENIVWLLGKMTSNLQHLQFTLHYS